ncbi:MAG: glucose-1-phosphate cytidylyltransferase [Candidatus Margulisbacteria bacterium]|jgi:glucose-1-phosphate cytidylyltransferase|nr:glucose-1-phosphate cytidylyltransferase [Candidatus Margulisiibacteriota bacterium]
MKVVILAGGLGTRISEESVVKPKPMIEIGDKPILWHIMKGYLHHGFNEFIICLGYKGYQIKEYFANYSLHASDVTFDFSSGRKEVVHANNAEPWKVTLVDTGQETMTGGRIKRVRQHLNDEPFMLTYGDGVADVDIKALLKQHRAQGKLATVTAVQPLGRFGALSLGPDGRVNRFQEKAAGDNSWINAGYFVLEPKVLDYIKDDSILFEKEPVEKLAREDQLMAYKHAGFWHPMDTLRDKNQLDELWRSGKAPWKVW